MMFKRMFDTTLKIVINLAVLVGTLVICFIVAEIGVRTAKVNIPQVQGYTITLDDASVQTLDLRGGPGNLNSRNFPV